MRHYPPSALLMLILLITLCLPVYSEVSQANDRLTAMEMKIVGQKYTAEPLVNRLSRLEKALHLPSQAGQSIEYRLEQLYKLQAAPVSAQAQREAILAYNFAIDETNQGRYESAIKAYQKAIQLNPGMIAAYNNLGTLFEHLHKYNDALTLYQNAILQAPNNPMLQRNIGVVYEKTGNIPAALRHYRLYVEQAPQPDEAIVTLVKNYDTHRQSSMVDSDYVDIARTGSQGEKLLWPPEANPIPFYLDFDPDQTTFLPTIRQCFAEWEKASQGRLRFREVARPDQGKIKVTMAEGPLAHPQSEVGRAAYKFTEDGYHRNKNLTVSITVNTGERNAPISLGDRLAQIKRLALHEIGHAIGIWGHSPNPDDVMYSHPIVAELSARDIRTVQRLYGIPTTRTAQSVKRAP